MNESRGDATEYFKRSVHYQLKFFEKLIDKIPFKDSDHVFDLGCGTAAMSAQMAKEIVPNGLVTACDPEESRIQLAKDKLSDIPNLHFIQATGSSALENKADLYDVIVSNFVLHWIEEEELKKTMVNMFNALKSGGIAAHNFLADMSSSCYTLRKICEKKTKGLVDGLHFIKKERFAELAKEIGFTTVYSESSTHKTEFDTVDDIIRLVDVSTHGLLGLEKLYSDAKSRGLQVEFDVSDAGKPIEVITLHSFILKKP